MTQTPLTNSVAGLTNAPARALRDIKPPVYIPNPWTWLWWSLGAVAVLAALYFAWKLWRRRRALLRMVPVIPPHLTAKKKLQEALALIGQPREFCILVSDTIRWYLEERFDFRAPERTTQEFLYELKATRLLTPDQKSSLGDFLEKCDLVKFAKYEPAEPELRDLHGSAVGLVEETQPVITATSPQPKSTATPAQPGFADAQPG